MPETYPAWPGIIMFLVSIGILGLVGLALEKIFGGRK